MLSKYWEEKEESGMIILAADESLTAAEHEKEGKTSSHIHFESVLPK